MKVIKKEKIISDTLKKNFKQLYNKEYVNTFYDNLPEYHLVNDNLEPVIRTEKVYDPKKEAKVVKQTPIVYSQTQIEALKKMGQKVEVITLAEIEAEKEALRKMIEAAEKRGYEKALEEQKK